MRKLTIIVVILAALYGGYWMVGSRSVSNGAQSAIAQMQDQGWQIDVADLSTKGFPSRFDTTLSDLVLAPPARNWRYSAPFVQSFALSYAPNEVIAVLPDTQTLDLPGQSLTITADKLRGRTKVAASTDLTYQGFTAEGDNIAVASNLDWSLDVTRLLVAMRPSINGPASYDLYGELLDITLGEGLDTARQGIPAKIEAIKADAVITLDKPLNRATFMAIETDPVVPTALNVKDMSLTWGDVRLRANGDLTIQDGIPTGRITVTVANWEQVIAALTQSGVLDPNLTATYRNVAGLLAGGGDTLDVPLIFRDGFVSAGPLPLGPAPRFY